MGRCWLWVAMLGALVGAARAESVPGHVVDAAGQPAAGVLVCGALWAGGAASPEAGGPVTTDAEGRFTLTLPAPVGLYQPRVAVAVAAGRGCAVETIPARATWLELRLEPGEEADGQVLDEALRPVAGARVSLSGLSQGSVYVGLPDGADGLWPAQTEADGWWRLTNLPSAWRRQLSVRAEGFAKAEAEVGSGFQPSPASMAVLAPGGSLVGRVLDPDSRPVPGVRLRVGADEATTGGDGLYRFDGLPLEPAELRLSAVPSGLWWADPLAVPALAPGQTARADLRLAPAAEVTGQVLEADGLPCGGVLLLLGPRGAPATCRTTSDAEGRFALRALPGTHTLRAAGYRQPKPTVVTVKAGEAPAPLVLRRSPRARLVALDDDRAPLANATLWVTSKWGPDGAASVVTDTRGEADIPDPVADLGQELLAWSPGLALMGVSRAPAGAHVEVRLTAPRCVPLAARVTTPDGTPLPQARVMMALQARLADGARTNLGERWSTSSDAAGAFRFDAVPEGWRATLRAERPGYQAGAPLVIEPPVPLLAGSLVLTPVDQSVSGIVVDAAGQPVAGAMVFGAGHLVGRPAISGADGTFRCPGLPARRVTLLALHGQRAVARAVCAPPAAGLRLVLAEAPRLSWADAPSEDDRDLAHDLLTEVLAVDQPAEQLERPLAVLARLDSTEALDHIARLPAGLEREEALLQLLSDTPAEVRFDAALLPFLAATPPDLRGLLAAVASPHVAADQPVLRQRLLAMVQTARQARDNRGEALLYDLAAAALARPDDARAAEAALRSARTRLAKDSAASRDVVDALRELDLDPAQLDALLPALADDGSRAAVQAAAVLRTLRSDARAAWALARAWWPSADGGVSVPVAGEERGAYPTWISGRLALGLLATDPSRARALLAAEPYDAGGFLRLLEAALTTTDSDLARLFLADAERCYPADQGWGDRLALAAVGLDDTVAQRCRARALSSVTSGADRPYAMTATDPNRARLALETAFAASLPKGDDCAELAIAMAAVDLPRAAEMARACRAAEDARTALACWLLAKPPARATLPLYSWRGGSAAPEQQPVGD